MKLYSVDVKIGATAYIKAESVEEARAKLEEFGEGIEVPSDDFVVSGRAYNDPKLPDVSLSPAMTIWGPWEGAQFEIVEEY